MDRDTKTRERMILITNVLYNIQKKKCLVFTSSLLMHT